MGVEWTGVFPALMTEFAEDGSLDLDATGRHIQSCIDAGVSGFVMLGTLGENPSLYGDEKEAVLTAAVEAAGDLPVLTGVAEYTTDMAIDHVRRAERAGCAGLMVLPCMVYPQDQREAMAHFRGVAEATDLPIMIYNNRVAYKVDLTPESFVELSDVDNIIAVKESSHDSRRITDMYNACKDRYQMFCGVDDLVLENVLFGAQGWVAGLVNSFPKESVRLFELAREGRVDEALEIYRWFMPLLHLDVDVKLVQMIKLANQIAGEGSEWVRRPRLTLEGEERRMVAELVETAIVNRPNL
ncbi:MAG: dihydrodipicolinate synthase family protein [Rhodospirillaceae bacterium]|nr:dihydrodipicolinate synthase family protein [Rhodospirillaceae bacterium]